MAGRSTRSKTQISTQQRESQSRAKWTPSLTKTIVEVMAEQVQKGHKQKKSFSKKGWNCICDEFQKRSGLMWERDQLKSRYIALRKQFSTVKLLLVFSDFTWDETTGSIIATDEAWDKYIKDHPDAETIRSSGCPFYKELSVIFDESRNGGTYNNGSNGSHDELSCSESEDVPDTNKQETDISRKRGRKGVDGAIANAISEMAAASRVRASAIERRNESFTIADCVKALDELEGVNDQVYYAALDLFDTRAAREIFLSLQVGRRLTWLIGKLSGRPTNLAAISNLN